MAHRLPSAWLVEQKWKQWRATKVLILVSLPIDSEEMQRLAGG